MSTARVTIEQPVGGLFRRVGAFPATTVLLAALLALALSGEAAAQKPGVFAGSLGVKVPKGGHATVRAVDAAGGVVVGADDVGRSGKFSLRLPAGGYVVRGVVIPKRGAVIAKTTAVSLKPGQRRRGAKLTAGRKKATKQRKRARAAFVTERGNVRLGTVAVGIHAFSGPPGGDLGAFSRGFADLLITDIVETVGRRCPGRVAIREVARMNEILREFELGKSRYADKSTFPERNAIIPDVAVRGAITQAPDGTPRVKVSITDARSGAALDTIEASLGADVFAGEEKVAGQLADKLCKLSETFEVTLDVNGAGRFATHNASGTMHAVLLARRSGAEWTATGPLQWQNASFTSKMECPYVDIIAPTIAWTVKITDSGEQLMVTWTRSGNESTTASVDCPSDGETDPPPIPGQSGIALINTGPESFPLPYTGGTVPISGVVQDGGDGFFNQGTITVKPMGIAPSG